MACEFVETFRVNDFLTVCFTPTEGKHGKEADKATISV